MAIDRRENWGSVQLTRLYGQHGDGLCMSIHHREHQNFDHALCRCGLTSWPREHHCPLICDCLRDGRFQPNLKAVSIYKSLLYRQIKGVLKRHKNG